MQPLRKILFQCPHCARKGWLFWSSPSGPLNRRISAGVEALSDGFYLRMTRTHSGDTEIICDACGAAQQELALRLMAEEPALPSAEGHALPAKTGA